MLTKPCKGWYGALLHNLANGELDNRQIDWIHKLSAKRTGPDILLIMARIDECSQEREQTINKIQHQVGNSTIFQISVSAIWTVYQQSKPDYRARVVYRIYLLISTSGEINYLKTEQKVGAKATGFTSKYSVNTYVAKHELTLLEQQQVIRENAYWFVSTESTSNTAARGYLNITHTIIIGLRHLFKTDFTILTWCDGLLPL